MPPAKIDNRMRSGTRQRSYRVADSTHELLSQLSVDANETIYVILHAALTHLDLSKASARAAVKAAREELNIELTPLREQEKAARAVDRMTPQQREQMKKMLRNA